MTRQEITEKYFTKWHYDSIPMKSGKDEYIAQVAKLANVANKRAKTLVVADEKGRIPLDRCYACHPHSQKKKEEEYTPSFINYSL